MKVELITSWLAKNLLYKPDNDQDKMYIIYSFE